MSSEAIRKAGAAAVLGLGLLFESATALRSRAGEAAPPSSPVATLRAEAAALEPLVRTPWVREFLNATAGLPEIPTRKLFHDAAKGNYYTEAEAARLSEEGRKGLEEVEVDGDYYYNTRYGTPLAYARPLDLLGRSGFSPAGRRILDFGYGGIGQLRLLAALGAGVVGVEIDPLTRALYSWPGDQGAIPGSSGTGGTIHLVHGRFPADEAVRREVGEGFDLVISKNVLKRGYVHPERPVPERHRIDLGTDDATFVRTLAAILKPGGHVLIYNLSPAQNPPDKPFLAMADGRSPFPAPIWESAGFRVLEFDRDDSKEARRMAHALGWDSGERPMNLEQNLFAHYTLLQKTKRR